MSGLDPSPAWDRARALPVGSHVALQGPDGHRVEGWLLPPDALTSDHVLKLKLSSGYNVGVLVVPGTTLEELGGALWGEERLPGEEGPPAPRSAPRKAPAPGTVAILTTGGTIASRVDYVTGGVHPVREPSNLDELYPGISEGGALEVRSVVEILSEDMTPTVWRKLAEEVLEEFQRGVRGVVIAQGTDTLSYTSAALAFQLKDLPGPVVLVGAQRSIDRPSSDGIDNMVGAVRVAREADLGEVVVAMHEGPSDGRLALHRGSRVRKMHATRRDAFRTLNGAPLGHVDESGVHLGRHHRRRHSGPARADLGFREEATLLWFRPGLSPEVAEAETRSFAGILLAGTGMGHVASSHLPWIRRAVERGAVVGMTTQCLEGEVDAFVYSRGRELRQAGVVYLGDLSPETAYVKLLWALARSPDPAEVRRLLVSDRSGEFGERRELLDREAPGGKHS